MIDRGSWINLIESTGELKTAMTIDRESPLVYNNTYNITVKAVDKSEYICNSFIYTSKQIHLIVDRVSALVYKKSALLLFSALVYKKYCKF